jgi:hypothetical protein
MQNRLVRTTDAAHENLEKEKYMNELMDCKNSRACKTDLLELQMLHMKIWKKINI